MHTKLKTHQWGFIVPFKIRTFLYVPVLLCFLTACTDFVEVDLPKDKITSETVFGDPAIAESALKGIYAKMRDVGFGDANFGLNVFMGIYTDELDYPSNSQTSLEFYNHNLLANNSTIRSWWSSAYNQIYEANALMEGVTNSTTLSDAIKDQFIGEALCIRAYLHLYLVELFGDIPYITSKDYAANTNATRMPKDVVYNNIIDDLTLAESLLPEDADEDNSDRIRIYKAVATAVLARTYLYTENWALAEAASTRVINKFGALEPDLDQVFLRESSGILWQFKSRLNGHPTQEALTFIINLLPTDNVALTESLFNAFEPNDLRKDAWIGTITNSTNTETLHYPFKYKEQLLTSPTAEYSVQLRLAEQYLIRAEARAQQGDVPGAQADINAIRNRAGLANTTAATLNELLAAILQERRVELFTERGHRWFDLKRMGKATEVLAPIKSGWRVTDLLLPIPENELLVNPNLLPQNDGY